jgi:hypothetical protein
MVVDVGTGWGVGETVGVAGPGGGWMAVGDGCISDAQAQSRKIGNNSGIFSANHPGKVPNIEFFFTLRRIKRNDR